MIPTIETIVEGLIDGTYSKQQAIGWLYLHSEEAYRGLRDDFAAAALQGLASVPVGNTGDKEVIGFDSVRAYQYADAMLAERAK